MKKKEDRQYLVIDKKNEREGGKRNVQLFIPHK